MKYTLEGNFKEITYFSMTINPKYPGQLLVLDHAHPIDLLIDNETKWFARYHTIESNCAPSFKVVDLNENFSTFRIYQERDWDHHLTPVLEK